jgi:signal transduction histidine kinase
VSDDGCGGATLRPGGGLQGLADRVQALGGHLEVTSSAGTGTVIRAVLPCAL